MAKRTMMFGSVIVVMAAIAAMAFLGQSCFLPESQVDVCSSGRACPPGWRCAIAQDVCVKGLCGNGVLDPGESCDDGNNLPGDGCSVVCTYCGDGIHDAEQGEVCDDGNNESGDECSADCLSDETCGNGYVDYDIGEECDDGNTDNEDGCVDECKNATCGDGYIWAGVEECDDGDNSATGACPFCQRARCGDGYVQGVGEVCDPNDPGLEGYCSPDCLSNGECGNGYVDIALEEECDDGNQNANDSCPSGLYDLRDAGVDVGPGLLDAGLCKIARCGDGFVSQGVEKCDPNDPNLKGYCSSDCRSDGKCGNGIVDTALEEECDDGNLNSNDSCPSGFNDIYDAGVAPTDAQAAADLCRVAYCGDHFVRSGVEVCDDGNHQVGDRCSPDCLSDETCGNGYLDVVKGEECDDGNYVDDDECPSGDGGCRLPYCGDGFISPDEDCDTNGRPCPDGVTVCDPSDCTC